MYSYSMHYNFTQNDITNSLVSNSSLRSFGVGNSIDSRKNSSRSHKKFLQAAIVTSLILMSIAVLSIPICIYYMKYPEIKKDLQLPNNVVDLQTCQGTINVVSK